MRNENGVAEPVHSDIRLVDAAVVLVRHWVAFILGFLFVLAVGVFYAVTTDDKYEYVSLYQLAEEASGKWLQSPAELVARVDNQIVPEYETSFLEENDRYLPFGVNASSPEQVGVLSLSTIAEASKAELIKAAHSHIVMTLKEKQDQSFNAIRESVEGELKQVEATIEDVMQADSAAPYVGELYRTRAQLVSRLNSMEEGEVAGVAHRSLRPISPNRKLIVVGAILGGLFFGVLLAFLSDFVCRVRGALRR